MERKIEELRYCSDPPHWKADEVVAMVYPSYKQGRRKAASKIVKKAEPGMEEPWNLLTGHLSL